MIAYDIDTSLYNVLKIAILFLNSLMLILELLELYVPKKTYILMKRLKLKVKAFPLYFAKGYIRLPGVFEIFCK